MDAERLAAAEGAIREYARINTELHATIDALQAENERLRELAASLEVNFKNEMLTSEIRGARVTLLEGKLEIAREWITDQGHRITCMWVKQLGRSGALCNCGYDAALSRSDADG